MRSRPDRPAHHLFVEGRMVGPLEVAMSRGARTRGLLGRDQLDGALLLPSIRSVHTFGMHFPIDVALCSRDLSVIAVRTVAPGRLVLPRRHVRAVLEAEAGAFAAWGLAAGSKLRFSEC